MRAPAVVLCAILGATDCRPTPSQQGEPAGSASPAPSPPAHEQTYTDARAGFQTRLTRLGPAPDPFATVTPPSDVRALEYTSGELRLRAWTSAPPADGHRQAGVLFLHGGFAFEAAHWELAKPFRDADFAVMMPMLRGENGMPGTFSLFYDEVDDVVAAAGAFAALAHVDRDHLYLAGWSVGGTLTLLAAMRTDRFRAAAAFSAAADMGAWLPGEDRLAPFDPDDHAEVRIRSAVAFPGSFRCPVRVLYGEQERSFGGPSRMLAALAQKRGLDVQAQAVPGDHFSAVPAEVARAIAFFGERR